MRRGKMAYKTKNSKKKSLFQKIKEKWNEPITEGLFAEPKKYKTKTFDIISKSQLSDDDITKLQERLNEFEIDNKEIFSKHDYFKLSPEQIKKRYNYLMDKWKDKKGKMRKDNPFNIRYEKVLNNFSHIELCNFIDIMVHIPQLPTMELDFQPVYCVYAKDKSYFLYFGDSDDIGLLEAHPSWFEEKFKKNGKSKT